jgi:3-methyladenine DNA glycosylase Mpg
MLSQFHLYHTPIRTEADAYLALADAAAHARHEAREQVQLMGIEVDEIETIEAFDVRQ